MAENAVEIAVEGENQHLCIDLRDFEPVMRGERHQFARMQLERDVVDAELYPPLPYPDEFVQVADAMQICVVTGIAQGEIAFEGRCERQVFRSGHGRRFSYRSKIATANQTSLQPAENSSRASRFYPCIVPGVRLGYPT